MKQFILPAVLLCFAVFCLVFVHLDNMDKIDKEKMALEKQDIEIYAQSAQ